ncbi:MAG: glutamate formiminotransferase / 5-formyltetrahydrofolate cyclo-ligase [Solirubrobacterales bacterium]|nr:glutamate formiminotransferase / 5-formyltetrahydrofolate cyclo-ligase [Solirubrobacterales bacterium]
MPNVSEGSDLESLADLERAFTRGATLLDRHTDADHNRTVFSLAGAPGAGLVDALTSGAAVAMEEIDMSDYTGAHPAIGALDVCPLVWLDPGDRGAARTEAVEVATQIGGLGVPVFLYGELGRDPGRAERAYFRNGGLPELWLRMEAGELEPDFGPRLPHRRAGATLVTARPPLAAFNVELDSDDLDLARSVAAGLREAGGGLPGVRAMGLVLSSGRGQVSTNVHDPLAVPLATVVERVRELAAPLGARPLEAELVGLIPAAALVGYPEDVPIRGFDPARHVIERRLQALAG